jgi:hypothetical protein
LGDRVDEPLLRELDHDRAPFSFRRGARLSVDYFEPNQGLRHPLEELTATERSGRGMLATYSTR